MSGAQRTSAACSAPRGLAYSCNGITVRPSTRPGSQPPEAFSSWLQGFLPQAPRDGRGDWLAVGIVNDPSDGKLVHLDGVNLSRAWNLRNIAQALPESDSRVPALLAAAEVHAEAGIASV